MRILVTGSRDWDYPLTIWNALLDVIEPVGRSEHVVIIHGGSGKADLTAGGFARQWINSSEEVHPADWQKHGKAAGPIRNQEMVDAGADICLAFIKNNSRGATHCADAAEKAGIPVRRYTA